MKLKFVKHTQCFMNYEPLQNRNQKVKKARQQKNYG